MKKLITLTICAMLVPLAAIAGTEKGDFELGVSSSLQRMDTDDSGSTSLTMALNGNVFLTDWFSVGGQFVGTSSAQDDMDGTHTFFLMIRPDFYVAPNSPVIPFVGPHIGGVFYSSGDSSDVTVAGGVHGGAKFFLGENTSFNLELNETLYTYTVDYYYSSDTIVVSVFQFLAGFSYYF